MGATDIASRLRAKLSRRQHSATASLASSTHSITETTSSQGSRHFWDRDHGADRASQRTTSQTQATLSSRQGHHGVSTVPKSEDDYHHLPASSHSASEDGLQFSTQSRNDSRSISPCPVVNSVSNPTTPPDESTTDSEPTATDTVLKQPRVPKTTANSSHSSPNRANATVSSSDQPAARNNKPLEGSQPRHPPSNPASLKPSTADSSPSPSNSLSRNRPVNSNLDRIREDSPAQSLDSTTTANPRPTTADAEAGVLVDGPRHHDDDPLNPAGSAPSTSSQTTSAPVASLALPLTPTITSSSLVDFSPGLAPPLTTLPTPGSPAPRPSGPPRRQSLLSNRQSTLIKTLLDPVLNEQETDPSTYLPIDGNMVTRKIWVRRPHASPTLVTINEDDLVDDVRDMILRKYGNSLGRTFDSPDLNIRICPRDQHKERILGPEEPMSRTLDAYYPGGQTVDEALFIDLPRRAPKASPRPVGPTVYFADDTRPSETSEGYFSTVGATASPHLPGAVPQQVNAQAPHSIAVLGTGYIPPVPSPGGTRRAYRDRPDRPRLGRQHTSSPTILANGSSTSLAAAAVAANHGNHGTQHPSSRQPHSRTHSNSSEAGGMPPTVPSIPTPPAPEPPQARVDTPPPQLTSPRPANNRVKKSKKSEHLSLSPGMLNGGVPPINVLIVEDNPINLKLLEAFVKRLRVRWQTAMNGRDAVKKWRSGGFHLVLMDIQLPIMNGLDATREIRRLERVNSIGVFSSLPDSSVPEEEVDDIKEQDRLETVSMFKSPVIIVALTASSLQSDRHEALAAGCNDFLTKVRGICRDQAARAFCEHNANTYYSLSILYGSNVKSWNGVVCRLSSILTAGASGRPFPKKRKKTKPTRKRQQRQRQKRAGCLFPRADAWSLVVVNNWVRFQANVKGQTPLDGPFFLCLLCLNTRNQFFVFSSWLQTCHIGNSIGHCLLFR